jgi:hypothetical protein
VDGPLDYLFRVLKAGFRSVVHKAHALNFAIAILAGGATELLKWAVPGVAVEHPDLEGWKVGAILYVVVLIYQLIKAPYKIYVEDNENRKPAVTYRQEAHGNGYSADEL